MTSSATDALVRVNRDLETALADLRPSPGSGPIPSNALVAIQGTVERGLDCLRELTQAPGNELQSEIMKYRHHLLQLIEILPSFHAGMLAEKRRLEEAASHLQSASAWAQGQRDGL